MTPISTSSNDRERSQEQLGFLIEKRVTTGVATINVKEPKMNTTTTQLPTTENPDWGFWGTMDNHADKAWPLAIKIIGQTTGLEPEAVRAFLDSRYGRHFADEVHNALFAKKPLQQAIETTAAKWMRYKMRPSMLREMDIPRGLPYLTSLIVHCDINAQLYP